MKFIDIPEDRQREAINTVALQTGLPPSSIEKDWWVTQVLKALHTLPYAEHIAFKGGTSLSKCWNLIARFSEDVDIALSREFLGFGGELSKTQISDRLRQAACSFVRENMRRIFSPNPDPPVYRGNGHLERPRVGRIPGGTRPRSIFIANGSKKTFYAVPNVNIMALGSGKTF